MTNLQNIVHKLIFNNKNTEHYGGNKLAQMDDSMMVSFFITYLIVYVILLFVGKWLWNTFLVDMFSVVRPVNSIWHLVALSILVKLVIY
jgi:hypothetical protein